MRWWTVVCVDFSHFLGVPRPDILEKVFRSLVLILNFPSSWRILDENKAAKLRTEVTESTAIFVDLLSTQLPVAGKILHQQVYNSVILVSGQVKVMSAYNWTESHRGKDRHFRTAS